jgi:hypothetical protein
MEAIFQPSQNFESSQPQLKVVPINLIIVPKWCSHKSISLILMLPKRLISQDDDDKFIN